MDKYINEKNFGRFKVNGSDYFGELKLSDEDSLLTVWGEHEIPPELNSHPPEQIHGVFNDLQKVTLLGLVGMGGGCCYGESENRYYSEIYPHYVVFGNRYVEKEECVFEALEFVVANSTTLFNDRLSFQQIFHTNKKMVEQLIAEDYARSKDLLDSPLLELETKVGDHPIISIFTGSHEICIFDTSYGRIEINNLPLYRTASSNGYSLENKVSCAINFPKQLNFEQANERLAPLVSIFELIMGESLQVLEYKLRAPSSKEYPDIFNIYQCSRTPIQENGKTPHPSQRLIQIESDPNEFKNVVKNWLSRQNEWKSARWQFFSSFTKNQYDTDRLIKVANMFDIIPDSAYGSQVELTTEVRDAKDACRKIFKELPLSLERNSILGALGRLGTKSLKHKVNIRSALVKSAIPKDLTDIEFITGHSIDCRNHFVHGGKRKFDYHDNFDMVCFFIDTLEFIYGVSELLDSGWDLNKWISKHPRNHPFLHYIEGYNINLIELKDVIKRSV